MVYMGYDTYAINLLSLIFLVTVDYSFSLPFSFLSSEMHHKACQLIVLRSPGLGRIAMLIGAGLSTLSLFHLCFCSDFVSDLLISSGFNL